jgi:hypothetical protein
MGLYTQATYFLFKCRVLLVALGDDQRIDSQSEVENVSPGFMVA